MMKVYVKKCMVEDTICLWQSDSWDASVQLLSEKLQVNWPCPLAQQAKKVAHLHD